MNKESNDSNSSRRKKTMKEYGEKEDVSTLVNKEKKSFKCSICEAKFTAKRSMKYHIATNHE